MRLSNASVNRGIYVFVFGVALYALGAATSGSTARSWHPGGAGAPAVGRIPHAARLSAVTSAQFATTTSATETLLLSPQDTYLNINDTTYSTEATLNTYTWPDRQVANAILMKFDLSTLPAGAAVQEATLHLALVASDASSDTTYVVSAHKVLGKNVVVGRATGHTADGTTLWSANACCYNSVPLAQADISSAYDRQAIDKNPGSKRWTLTAMIQEWAADPTTNFGLLLNSDASKAADRFRSFASMEHPDATLRPVLRIAYTMPARQQILSPQDTYLNINRYNYSADSRITAYTWPDRQPSNAILMKFDLSSLPAGAVVHDATLQLVLVESDTAPETTYTITAHKVVGRNPDITKANGYTTDGTTAWTPTDCCYGGVPLAQADIAPAYDGRQIDKVRGRKIWTLTRMVQEWVASPSTNFGVLLNADASKLRDRYRVFASGEHPDSTLRPVLRIAYSVPSQSAVLAPQQDTYLNINATNYSGSPRLATYTWPSGRVANAILMLFDLSGLPEGAVVQEALLHLALAESDAYAEPTYAVSAHKLVGKNPFLLAATGYTADGVQPWTPNACCHNGVPLAQADISASYDMRAIDKARGWKVWTLTEMVRDWQADPATNLGVLLNSDPSKLQDRYRYFASIEEPDSRMRPFLRVAYTIPPQEQPDSAPPSVAVTAPSDGATVTGTVTVAASATDEAGVAGVLFELDGTAVGSELTAEPYVLHWDTSLLSDGEYILTARARDRAGNVGTSPAVRVKKDRTPPTVSITAPAAGASVSGTLTVSVDASDTMGVAGVQFGVDGISLGAEDTAAPYATSWNTAGAANGAHTLTAVARDAAGNAATAAVTVTVANPPTITSFTPTGGAVGTAVTIGGTRFIGATAVRFNGTSASYNVISPTAISATVPASATTGPISVTTAGGTATSSTSFTVIPPPTISSFTPTSGPVGNAVTISGTDFAGATAVKFNGTAASFTVSSGTAIQATVPSGATTGPISVTTAGGTTTTSSSFTVSTSGSGGSIASRYPGDVGIEGDPNVVFVERFDESSLTNLFSRWTDVLNGSAMSFSGDAPSGSPVGKSLNIPWSSATNGGHLYRQLSPGIDDTLYVRYYVKYPTSGSYQHEGVWMGGSNPPLSWPNPQAGIKPTGSDRFIASGEQRDDLTKFDHYDYWMGMRQSGDGKYWGNVLLNDPNVRARAGQWMCVEHMVKLNSPTSALNGEHAIWLDGVKVSHLGQGFPKGFWSGGIFTRDPSGSPFEGFQWRNTTSLNLNWIWLQVYAPNGGSGSIKYAHVVAAKSSIGCLTSGSSSDSTPPTATLTAPAGGATVSGTVTVSAGATDDVGVAGVQFKLNGINLGAEDTTAPYSISWNTTSVANGSHSLTAVARDAGGNQTTSPAVSVTVSNGSSGGVIFESNWAAATGTSSNAITDGGLWPIYRQYDNPPTPGMSVVTGGPNGQNALRVQQRGPYYPVEIAKTNFVAQGRDYYLRYYFKTDDTSGAGDHIVTVGPGIAVPPGDNLTFLRKYGGTADWHMVLSAYGCGDPIGYPLQHWGPGPRLSNGQWYRFEYYVHFTDATHMQVHPRVYDAAGVLLYDDDDFRQENWGTSRLWNGRNDWTLASFYAGGHSFCVDPVVMNGFGMGNNGQSGATNTGRYWYFAAVQIRTDTWPGPVPAAGTASSGAARPPDTGDIEFDKRLDAINTDRLDEDTLTVVLSRAMPSTERCLSLRPCQPVRRDAIALSRAGRRRRGARSARTLRHSGALPAG